MEKLRYKTIVTYSVDSLLAYGLLRAPAYGGFTRPS
jgi:hypothetical protein